MDNSNYPKYTKISENVGVVSAMAGNPISPPNYEISAFIQKMYDDIRRLEKRVDCIEGQIRDIENHVDLSDY